MKLSPITRSVCPSRAASAASAAKAPAAPGLFSTMMVMPPSGPRSRSASSRAMTSLLPPAWKPTIRRSVRSGQARAVRAETAAATPVTTKGRRAIVMAASVLEDRHGARPTGGRAADLVGEAGDGEAVAGQRLEIVQLLEMAVADVAARLVAFPDDRGVVVLGPLLGREVERRVPAPGVGPGQADAALEQEHGGVVAHAAARVDVVVVAVARAGPGVDHDDLERLELVADAFQLLLDLPRGDDVAVGLVAEVELDAGLEAPFERHLVDRDGALALVHRRMEVIRRVEVG